MPVNTREIINALEVLAQDRQVRVTVRESVKGGVLTGVCATLGGIFGGPVGLAGGGIIGAIGASMMGAGKYKSVISVIQEMDPNAQEVLANSVYEAIRDVRPEDALMIAPLLLNNANVQQVALQALISFLQSEMGMQVII